jgi:hypothetical protein
LGKCAATIPSSRATCGSRSASWRRAVETGWEVVPSKCDGYGMCSVLRAEALAGILEARFDRFRGYSALAPYFTERQSLGAVGQERHLTRTEVEGCSFTPRDVVKDAICDAGGWGWWIPACLDEDVNQLSPRDPGLVAHTAPSGQVATKRRTLYGAARSCPITRTAEDRGASSWRLTDGGKGRWLAEKRGPRSRARELPADRGARAGGGRAVGLCPTPRRNVRRASLRRRTPAGPRSRR